MEKPRGGGLLFHRDSALRASGGVELQNCFVMQGQGSLEGGGFAVGERKWGEGEEQEGMGGGSPFPHGTQKLQRE